MGLTELLCHYNTLLIQHLGYTGVFVLMTLESMIAPVPSELVMPFAGFLIFTGQFTVWGVLAASTLGSIVGSLLSYGMGVLGKPVVLRYGRYLLLNPHHLDWTTDFFRRRGNITIFISRFIPVVRHLISIPAGMARMALLPFIVYTAIGATMWNMFLAYMGLILKENWQIVQRYTHVLDIFVAIALVAGLAYFIWKFRSVRNSAKEAG
ncbi:MAG: DedA family protein [Deltaproteobacteria bacterium]|nr:DedA family protein [Deltaproteobacteria bacterium]